MKDKEKRINEMSRDMCFIGPCNTKSCYAVNCETTWFAEKLIDLNYQKVDKDSVVLTKAEKQKLLHEMYEQGRFDALADLEKEGRVILLHDEFCSMIKTDKEAIEYGQQCWNDGKKQGVEEFADFIKSQMGMERDYMGIKYKQGVFSDLDIDAFVLQFNNRYEEN